MSDSLISSEVDLEKDGKQFGYLRLPHSVHRSAYGWIPFPIAVVRNGEGPTALLMAGNHGDEYEGQVILSKLIRQTEPADITGRLIVLPMANFPAAQAGLRTSPIDEGNLNRSFPGASRGTPTEAIAHYIESVLLAEADYLFDLHSGGSSLVYLPSMLMPWEDGDPRNAERHALLEAFALPYALFLGRDVEGYYSSAAAYRQGALSLTTEIGGGGWVDPALMAAAERGLMRGLAAIGIYRGGVGAEPHPTPTMFLEVRPEHYVFAQEAGLFEPLADLGDIVAGGQPAALIHHPETPGREPDTVTFNASGLVLCKRVPARVERGDCVFHLAADPLEARS